MTVNEIELLKEKFGANNVDCCIKYMKQSNIDLTEQNLLDELIKFELSNRFVPDDLISDITRGL